MAKNRIMNRANFLDLVVETEIGYINIEVSNNSYNKYIAYRNFIYLTSLINNVTKEGMKPNEFLSLFQINLIFGDSNKNYEINNYNIYSVRARKILTEKVEVFNVNVDKLKEIYYYKDNKKLTNKLPLIALAMTREELEERKDENEMLEKLLKKLDTMEDKGIAPEIMPIEEENKWYREIMMKSAKEEGLEQGIEQGIEQNKIKTAEIMLQEDMDINLISKVTGMSKESIINIAKGM